MRQEWLVPTQTRILKNYKSVLAVDETYQYYIADIFEQPDESLKFFDRNSGAERTMKMWLPLPYIYAQLFD